MDWDGLGQDGPRWVDLEWASMDWHGLRWDEMGWDGLGWVTNGGREASAWPCLQSLLFEPGTARTPPKSET